MTQDRKIGFALIAFAACGYAFLPTLARYIYSVSSIQPTDVAVWRFVFAIPPLWVVLALMRRGQVRPFSSGVAQWKLAVLGFTYSLSVVTAFFGLERLPASVFIVLIYSYPAMVALSSALRGIRLTGATWAAVALTLLGVVFTVPEVLTGLFTGSIALDMVGVLIALGNAAAIALYYLITPALLRHTRDEALSSIWIITWTGLSCATLVAVNGLRAPEDGRAWAALLALGIVSTSIPMFCLALGIQRLGATQASLVSTLEPLLSIVLAVLLLGETLTLWHILGALLIVAAMVLLALRPMPTATSPAPATMPESA